MELANLLSMIPNSPPSTFSHFDKSHAQQERECRARIEADEALAQLAGNRGLVAMPVKADGECLFYAINASHFAQNNSFVLDHHQLRSLAYSYSYSEMAPSKFHPG